MSRIVTIFALLALGLCGACGHTNPECRAQVNACLKRCGDMGPSPAIPTSQEGHHRYNDSRTPCEDRCYNTCRD